MKTIFNIIRRAVLRTSIFILFVFCLAACTQASQSQDNRLKIVASTQIVGDVVAAIGGDAIDLEVLVPPQGDPHSFEPAPRDAALLADSSLVFISGLNLEENLTPLLQTVEARLVSLSDQLETLESEHEDEGHEHEEGEHIHEHEGADPHVWMDPQNVKVWADLVASALSETDAANSATYVANAQAYKAELDELDAWAMEQFTQIEEEDRILVTDHEALGYFAEHYGFTMIGALVPSYSTASEPTAAELAELEAAVREHGVKAIFVGANLNSSLAERVAADTGVVLVPLYTETLSDADGPAATYTEMMRYNVAAIVEALK
jgi:ABC-type Zn uptake system ZnuABC Zn-binding protein ZnuA